MSDLMKLGQDLLNMGQKIIDSQGSGTSEKKKDDTEEDDKPSNVVDMPKKALIIASLKRKIGE